MRFTNRYGKGTEGTFRTPRRRSAASSIRCCFPPAATERGIFISFRIYLRGRGSKSITTYAACRKGRRASACTCRKTCFFGKRYPTETSIGKGRHIGFITGLLRPPSLKSRSASKCCKGIKTEDPEDDFGVFLRAKKRIQPIFPEIQRNFPPIRKTRLNKNVAENAILSVVATGEIPEKSERRK